jgi:proline iminopeptidase
MDTSLTRLLCSAALTVAMVGCDDDGFAANDPGKLVLRTVTEDATLPAITVNGTRLHAETFGTAGNPMVVVIHGGPGSDYRSLLNCQAFAARGYFVVFYDQRGSGLSERHPGSRYTLTTMQEDLGALIAYYRRSPSQKVFLLGHSWGAMLATAYVNANPNAVDGLILGEPGGLVWRDIEAYVSRSRSFPFSGETMNDVTYLDQFFTGRDDQHAILDFKLGMAGATTDGAADNPSGDEGPVPFWRAGAVVTRALFDLGQKQTPDWTTNLAQLRAPVLFVYSQNNRAYGEAWARRVSAPFPAVRLVRITDAGHNMLTFPRGWENFFPVAAQFLDSLR